MTAMIRLPLPSDTASLELARMLLARKLTPDDHMGTLSPMVNAPLAQCLALHPGIAPALAAWLPRLQDRFVAEMGDRSADPSLAQHLSQLPDDAARTDLIRQYALPFSFASVPDLREANAIASAFGVASTQPPPDMGALFPAVPQDGGVVLPKLFIGQVFRQVLRGRHSHLFLETLRTGGTNTQNADAAIHAFLAALGTAPDDVALRSEPFHTPELRQSDFAASPAYAHMMELGFSREEMISALSPWTLVD